MSFVKKILFYKTSYFLEKDIVVFKPEPLSSEILDPIITLADKSAIVLPVINNLYDRINLLTPDRAPGEFVNVVELIEKSPNVIYIDLENETVPDAMEDVNFDIQKTHLPEIDLVASKNEDEFLVDEIYDILKTKGIVLKSEKFNKLIYKEQKKLKL